MKEAEPTPVKTFVFNSCLLAVPALAYWFAYNDASNPYLWATFFLLVIVSLVLYKFDSIKEFSVEVLGMKAFLKRRSVPFSIGALPKSTTMPAEEQEFTATSTERSVEAATDQQSESSVRQPLDFRLPVYCILSKNKKDIQFLVTVTIEEKDRLLMYSHRERAKLYIEEESSRDPEDDLTILEISTEQMLLNVLDKMPSSIDEVIWDAVSYRPEFFKFLSIETIRPKTLSEDFSQGRMERAMSVAKVIQDNWQMTNRFDYKVTCAEPIVGKSLEELSRLNFAVGIEGNQVHLPLLDMLVVFSFVAAMADSRKHIKASPEKTSYEIKVELKTTFTQEEVRSWLDQIQIDTA